MLEYITSKMAKFVMAVSDTIQTKWIEFSAKIQLVFVDQKCSRKNVLILLISFLKLYSWSRTEKHFQSCLLYREHYATQNALMQFSAIHLFKIILHIYAISRQISYNNSN